MVTPDIETPPRPKEADEEHHWYLFRLWQLYQDARHAGVQPNVKLLDHYVSIPPRASGSGFGPRPVISAG